MDNREWLPLSEVVEGMMRCIEDEDIKGGEILEILTGKQRIMPLGGPLPSRAGKIPVCFEVTFLCCHFVLVLEGWG